MSVTTMCPLYSFIGRHKKCFGQVPSPGDERTRSKVAGILYNELPLMTAEEFTQYVQSRGRADDLNALFDKLGFSTEFVLKNVLSTGGPVTVSHVAMLWQGMPNKHDRKRTHQLFDALSDVGLLEPKGDDETWLPKIP